MQAIKYPGIDNPERSLSGIFTIKTDTHFDTVLLGEIVIGFIGLAEHNMFEFTPESAMDNPYPQRSTYTSILFDVFTHIANDLDLAIELAVMVNRKKNTPYSLESK